MAAQSRNRGQREEGLSDDFADVRVVITGAGRHFGRSLAINFARRGAEVFLSARQPADAERARAEIAGLGRGRAHAFGFDRSSAHPAFYAAKSAQRGFADIMSERLRRSGIRVISLYPPDFDNPDPLSADWDTARYGPDDELTAQPWIDSVAFAVSRPRNCFIRAIEFEAAG